MNNNPIGVFDSGIGGLTVTKEIVRQLPNESIIYLGDTARVPYGPRSKEAITKFALELTEFLLKRKVKCLVVACNTISATCLDEITKISPVPVLGVVEPAVKFALQKGQKIGVIGTTGTINSKAYEKKISEFNSKIKVISVACPLFVPIAEEGFGDHLATKLIVEHYLSELKDAKIDTLILGCTHYPLLSKSIQEVIGRVNLIDSAGPSALELEKLLQERSLLSENKNPTLEIFVTDAPGRVYEVASRFFGKELGDKIKKITL